MDKAHEILDKLTDFIDQQDRMRKNILTATKLNKLTKKQPVDINEVLRSVIAVYETDLFLSKRIIFRPELSEKVLIINAIPFEIFTVFQNIIQNVVDIAKFTKKPVTLTIRTEKERKTITILFSDTGPGFKKYSPGAVIVIENMISHKVAKGFGLKYIEKTVKANEGKVEIMNNKERGASVKIQFIT
jgi:K+-sensing histidine kinase KdpD